MACLTSWKQAAVWSESWKSSAQNESIESRIEFVFWADSFDMSPATISSGRLVQDICPSSHSNLAFGLEAIS
jgi:hypothetical protein